MSQTFPAWMGRVPRACSPWTREEEQELVRAFKQGSTPRELAHKHGRAIGGIESRLGKLIPGYLEMQIADQSRLAKDLDALKRELNTVQEMAAITQERADKLSKDISEISEMLRQRGCRFPVNDPNSDDFT